MSSESLESSNTSTEDIELKEIVRRPDSHSESDSSADISASCRWPITQIETSGDEANDSAISFLNSSDENHHALNIGRTSLQSLGSSSSGDLTWKASSLEGTSIRRVSSLNTLEGSLTRRVSSLNTLEEPSTRRVSSLNTLEEPSTRRVSSLNTLEEHSNRRVSSLNTLEGPSSRKISPFDSLKRPSSRKISSSNSLKTPKDRRVPPLDTLEGPLVRRVPSLDPLEGPSVRRVPSVDPLEGPSTRTVWFPDSLDCSLKRDRSSHHSETATNEHFNDEPPTEQDSFRAFDWLKSFLRRHSRQFRHSAYYPFILGVLTAIPYSAAYMGCMHFYLCSGCSQLPLLVFLEGLLGTCILSLQLITVLSKRYFSPPLTGQEFKTLMATLCFAFFLFLIVEMSTIYSCEPVFVPPHEEFCVKAFYDYAYRANIAVPIVILFLMLITIPGYFDPSEA